MLEFRSKVDGWFVVAGLVVVILGGSAVVRALINGNVVLALICVVPIALFAWIVLTTRYTLSDEALDVRCAFMRLSIPLASITRIRPTRNPLSSPALSLDRLEIQHANGMVMVSPRDRERFVQALRARCPAADVSDRAG